MQKGCPKCGRMIDADDITCPYCHYNFQSMDNFFKKVSDDNYIENEKYAGFVKRLVAGLFDIFLIATITYFILILIDKYFITINKNNIYIGLIIFIPIYILYNAICERTTWQGSIGKLILDIEVTDQYENPVTFPIALKRNIAKLLNVITLGIGFILSAAPPQKQALNDKIANTFVINKLIMKEDINFSFASPIKRFTAFIIDILIISLICYGILATNRLIRLSDFNQITLNTLSDARYILCLVVIFFYFPFSESRTGSTIGKGMMHIKVTKLNGEIQGVIGSFIRQLILVLDIFTLGFLASFVTPKKQTVKDILTRTLVIDR